MNEKRPFLLLRIASATIACLLALAGAGRAEWNDDPSIAGSMKPANASAASEAVKKLEGVYKTRFANATVQDEHFASEDILEVVSYDSDKIYFRIHLEFFNGHVCDIFGIAVYEDGKFVFRHTNDGSTDICEFTISIADGNVSFDDAGGNCRTYYCGARGGFHGSGFPMKSRRVIKYMKVLKASRQYAEAIAEFANAPKRPGGNPP